MDCVYLDSIMDIIFLPHCLEKHPMAGSVSGAFRRSHRCISCSWPCPPCQGCPEDLGDLAATQWGEGHVEKNMGKTSSSIGKWWENDGNCSMISRFPGKHHGNGETSCISRMVRWCFSMNAAGVRRFSIDRSGSPVLNSDGKEPPGAPGLNRVLLAFPAGFNYQKWGVELLKIGILGIFPGNILGMSWDLL